MRIVILVLVLLGLVVAGGVESVSSLGAEVGCSSVAGSGIDLSGPPHITGASACTVTVTP